MCQDTGRCVQQVTSSMRSPYPYLGVSNSYGWTSLPCCLQPLKLPSRRSCAYEYLKTQNFVLRFVPELLFLPVFPVTEVIATFLLSILRLAEAFNFVSSPKPIAAAFVPRSVMTNKLYWGTRSYIFLLHLGKCLGWI